MKWPFSKSTTSYFSAMFCAATTGIAATTYYTIYAGSVCRNAILGLSNLSFVTPAVSIPLDIIIEDITIPVTIPIPSLIINAELIQKYGLDVPAVLNTLAGMTETACSGVLGTHAAEILGLMLLAGTTGYALHQVYEVNKKLTLLAKQVNEEESADNRRNYSTFV